MLVRWIDPFENFVDLFNMRRGQWIPFMETKEEENKYTISAELPGMDEKDVKVTISKDVLTVEGEKKTEKYKKSFTRSFTLPTSIDSEGIEALLERGILTVNIPKMPEKALKKIEVKVNGPPKRSMR